MFHRAWARLRARMEPVGRGGFAGRSRAGARGPALAQPIRTVEASAAGDKWAQHWAVCASIGGWAWSSRWCTGPWKKGHRREAATAPHAEGLGSGRPEATRAPDVDQPVATLPGCAEQRHSLSFLPCQRSPQSRAPRGVLGLVGPVGTWGSADSGCEGAGAPDGWHYQTVLDRKTQI